MKASEKKQGGCTCPKCGAKFGGNSVGSHAMKCDVSPAELFWQKVNRNGPGGCWLWTGSIKPRNGYGNMTVKAVNWNTHRFAYAQVKGAIPKGMEVMHTCDVPHCVNPEHLRLGTHAENMADCKAKGRNTKTGNNLTFEQRSAIAKRANAARWAKRRAENV